MKYLILTGIVALTITVSGCCTLYEEEGKTTIIGLGKVKSKTGAEGDTKIIPSDITYKE